MSEHVPNPSEEQLRLLKEELADLTADAHANAKRVRWWAYIWQVVDLFLGLAGTVLAAVAGITGLASTTGRILAAWLALAAAALTAAAKFLRSGERYETDWMKVRAWRALYRSSSAASKGEDSHDAQKLYALIKSVLACRIAIMEIGHDSIPDNAILKFPVNDDQRQINAARSKFTVTSSEPTWVIHERD